MMAIRAEAGRGWGWIVDGWRLFAKSPGVWVVILLIYLAISVVLSLIPLIGLIGHTLLNPVLIAGMIYGAAAQARGETLEIGHLFQGFRDQERMGPLIILGVFSIAGYVLMLLTIGLFVGGSIATGVVLDNTGTGCARRSHRRTLLAGAGLIVTLISDRHWRPGGYGAVLWHSPGHARPDRTPGRRCRTASPPAGSIYCLF
jgi:hypothetical protein